MSLSSWAAEYQLRQGPREIRDHREYIFSIIADDPIELGALPKHPKIFWLSETATREKQRVELDAYRIDVRYMATAIGQIQFPPIPVKIGDENILLRLNDVTAKKNPFTEDQLRFQVLWNDLPEIPKQVYIGQAFKIEFEVMCVMGREGCHIHLPSRQIDGVDWFVFTLTPGRRSRDQDYFRSYQASSNWFGPPNNQIRYLQDRVREDSQLFRRNRYQARLTVGATQRLKGHFYVRAMNRNGERMSVIPLDIPVKSVPPLEDETAIDTGLIGNWTIKGALAPPQLTVGHPFKLALGIVGNGNPTLLRDLDFSAPGFSSIGMKSRHLNEDDRNATKQRMVFHQEFLPSGDAPIFPAITLATFEPHEEAWEFHKITSPITLDGLSQEVLATTVFTPAADIGAIIRRPVLLNLPKLTFALIALAPFLPFFAGFLKKHLDQRDPELEARKRQFKELVSKLNRDDASLELLDDSAVPFLKNYLKLPAGATTRDVADKLEAEHPEISGLLRKHSAATFSPSSAKIDLKKFAAYFAKISLLLFLFILPLRGASLEDANQAFADKRYRAAAEQYESLIDESPGHVSLHLNLAKAQLSADQASRARAACHTALLLDPLNSEGRELMDQILNRLGQPTLPGTQILSLRPDQFLFLAAFFWFLAFLIYAFCRFKTFPRWPAFLCFLLVGAFIMGALWRHTRAYLPGQYMVLAEELPREPQVGTPNWDYPALRSGQIVEISEMTETHGQVVTAETSFWIPLNQTQQVW